MEGGGNGAAGIHASAYNMHGYKYRRCKHNSKWGECELNQVEKNMVPEAVIRTAR